MFLKFKLKKEKGMEKINFNMEADNTPALLGMSKDRSDEVDVIRKDILNKVFKVESVDTHNGKGQMISISIDSGKILKEFTERFQPRSAAEYLYVGWVAALLVVDVKDETDRAKKMGQLVNMLGIGHSETRGPKDFDGL